VPKSAADKKAVGTRTAAHTADISRGKSMGCFRVDSESWSVKGKKGGEEKVYTNGML